MFIKVLFIHINIAKFQSFTVNYEIFHMIWIGGTAMEVCSSNLFFNADMLAYRPTTSTVTRKEPS